MTRLDPDRPECGEGRAVDTRSAGANLGVALGIFVATAIVGGLLVLPGTRALDAVDGPRGSR